MSLYGELKRRNVIRVAIAYLVVAWLLFEAADVVFPILGVPGWSIRILLVALALGFLLALVLAWSYVITPGGLVRDASIARSSARRLDVVSSSLVVVVLVIIVVLRIWSGDDSAQQPAIQGEIPAASQGQQSEPAVPAYPANSIAVLPFVNMSDDEANEYFSDGISEELLNLLAKVPELRVTSRSSAFSFKGKDFDIPAVARKLNVAHVLEGSVRKADDRVRITTQLIDTRTDAHLWSSTYDRKLNDIFAIQDEIARTVVQQLKVTLLGDVPRSAQVDPEAYTLYLQARHLGRQYNAESLERSNELYEQSLAIEADIAGAWSGLATNYTNAIFIGLLSPGEGYPLARAAAEKALAIDPAYAPAHANLGWITYGYDNDVAQAAKHYQRALELDPSNTFIMRSAAVLLSSLNRLEEAIVLGEYVTRLDPLIASGHHNLGTSYLRAHRWDEAVASHQTALQLSPDFIGGNYFKGVALLFGGEPAAALDAFALEQDDEYRIKGMTLALHALGRLEESQARLAELKEQWGEEWPTEVAHVYAYIGDADAAFQWLDRAIEKNEEGLSEQFLQPFYQGLYTDARWQTFLKRVGSSPERLAGIEFNVVLPD